MNLDKQVEYLPEAARQPVLDWIAQGRSEEQIHGVFNFFSGKGAQLIEATREQTIKQLMKIYSKGDKTIQEALEELRQQASKLERSGDE